MDLRQECGALRYDGRFGKFVNFSAIKIRGEQTLFPADFCLSGIKCLKSNEDAFLKALFIGGKSLFVTQTAH